MVLFHTSAGWKISRGEAEGLLGKKKEGLAVHNEVCMPFCVCQGMPEIQSTAEGSEGL